MVSRRPVTLRAATVLSPQTAWPEGHVAVRDGLITSAGPGAGPQAAAVDLGERIVAPGFVDVHVHGGAGHQVNGAEAAAVTAAVTEIARFHARHGTCAVVATTVSDTADRLAATLHGVADAAAAGSAGGARVLGSHLEGPWLAPTRTGAHDPAALRPPSPDDFDGLLAAARGTLRSVTLAPELPGALGLIVAAAAAGVTVCVGHTEADFEQARAAFRAGARHVTHLFNAMPPLHHRAPGPIGAALADPSVTVEVIADGHHVHPALLAVVGAAAAGRVVAVTDATAAAGQPAGPTRLGDVEAVVDGTRVTRRDRPDVLAGSVLTMDAAVRALVAAGWTLPAAVTAATLTPADVIGEPTSGRLAPGGRADLVVLEPDLSVAATLVGGVPVWDPQRLLG